MIPVNVTLNIDYWKIVKHFCKLLIVMLVLLIIELNILIMTTFFESRQKSESLKDFLLVVFLQIIFMQNRRKVGRYIDRVMRQDFLQWQCEKQEVGDCMKHWFHYVVTWNINFTLDPITAYWNNQYLSHKWAVSTEKLFKILFLGKLWLIFLLVVTMTS